MVQRSLSVVVVVVPWRWSWSLGGIVVMCSAECKLQRARGIGEKKSCAVDVWYDPKDEMNQMIIKHGLF